MAAGLRTEARSGAVFEMVVEVELVAAGVRTEAVPGPSLLSFPMSSFCFSYVLSSPFIRWLGRIPSFHLALPSLVFLALFFLKQEKIADLLLVLLVAADLILGWEAQKNLKNGHENAEAKNAVSAYPGPFSYVAFLSYVVFPFRCWW